MMYCSWCGLCTQLFLVSIRKLWSALLLTQIAFLKFLQYLFCCSIWRQWGFFPCFFFWKKDLKKKLFSNFEIPYFDRFSVKYSSYLVSWEWVYGSHLLWGTELCVLWEAFIFLDRFFFFSVQSTCKIPPMQQTCKGVWALMVCFLFCFWDMLCFTLLGVLPDTEIAYT